MHARPRSRRALSLLALVASVMPSCVVAYDASAPESSVAATRAQAVGVAAAEPPARAQRFARAQNQARPVETIAASREPAIPEAPASTDPAPLSPPDSPAGRELAWVISLLDGAETTGLRGSIAFESHFAESFLKAVPPAQIRSIITQWRRDEFDNGPVQLVRLDSADSPSAVTAIVKGQRTAKHTQILLRVDDQGKIAGLLLSPISGLALDPTPNWAKLEDDLRDASGPEGRGESRRLSFGAYELPAQGAPPALVYGFGHQQRLAIGSTFKVYILLALAEHIHAGKATWDQPLPIADEFKSLPSGVMQLREVGTEYALREYATKMISISDNTATDHLLAFLGRERVEATMARLHPEPALNRPFLSTLEMFKLKLAPDRTLADRYARADEAARRAMLAPGGEVASQTPSLIGAALWRKPFEIDRVEWFASADDLAALYAEVRRKEQLPGLEPLGEVMRVNPGVSLDRKSWPSIAFKGGSEPGVINLTFLLQRHDQRWFVVSLSWNDTKEPVDDKRAIGWIQAASRILADKP